MGKKKQEKVVKVEEVVETAPQLEVKDELKGVFESSNVTVHLDRDPNDPRLVRPADELPTLDKE